MARTRHRLTALIAAVAILSADLLGGRPAVALDRAGGIEIVPDAESANAPVYFREVLPVDVAPSHGGALPLEPDPTIGRGPDRPSIDQPTVPTELVNARTEHTRTIANPDGTYTVEASGGRLHFRDAEGDWVPLDLSLTELAATDIAVADGFGLGVAASDRTIRFGTADAASALLSLGGNGLAYTLRAPGYGEGFAVAGTDRVSYLGPVDAGALWVRPTDHGAEFAVTLTGSGQAPTYRFVLDPADLAVALGPDGSTVLLTRETDRATATVGVIGAPILVDAAGETLGGAGLVTVNLLRPGDSTDDALTAELLKSVAPGEVVLEYAIDQGWLADPARVFPITLDPTACVGAGASGCTINGGASADYEWVFSERPDSWAEQWTVDRLGYDVRTDDGAVYSRERVLAYFPDVALPDGAVITAATTKFTVNMVYGSPGGNYLRAYRVTVPWDPNDTSWNTIMAGGYDAASISPAYQVPSGVGSGDALTFDVADIARSWYTRRIEHWRPNTGLLVRMCATAACDTAETSALDELSIRRYTHATASSRPLLTLTYDIPGITIDFDPALGSTYAPATMVAGTDTDLPIRLTNTDASTISKCADAADTDCYQAGYRWFGPDGATLACASGTCTVDLPNGIAPDGTSATFDLPVRAPTAIGQYTLRLDLVRRLGGSTGTYLWSSDWASPSRFYSRDKRISGTDSTRWTGTSVIERDEFGIDVVAGGGTNAGVLRSVGTGDGGALSINLATRNLRYEGDTGLGFADLGTNLRLFYGYDRANEADCTGILAACGWYTNWDERIIGGPADAGTFTYQDPSGNRSFGVTGADSQLIAGAGVRLSRPRITWYDENPLASGANATAAIVNAAGEGITTYSGPNVVETVSSTSTSLGSVEHVPLNAFPMVSFAVRSTGATGTGIDFKIRNRTTGTEFWFAYTVGTNFTTGLDQVALGGTIANAWKAVVRRNLYADVYLLHGAVTDQYEVIAFQTTTNGQAGSTYIDAVRFQGRDDLEVASYPGFFKDANPTWTANGSLATLTTTDTAVGTGAIKVNPAALTSSPLCDSQSGATCHPDWNMASWPFVSWWWRKAGGTTGSPRSIPPMASSLSRSSKRRLRRFRFGIHGSMESDQQVMLTLLTWRHSTR